MIHLERTILILLALWGVACAIYWTAGVVRFIRTRRAVPSVTDGAALPDPDQWPTVCIVIPAHNEARVIGDLLATLKAQDYPADKLRVVFSLDRCTDETESILREGFAGDPRFGIHAVTHCPPEWAGKVHALWHAVMNSPEAFDADILVFVDADTLLQPSCVRWCLKLLRARGCGLLSLYSTLAKRFWFEKTVQTAAAGELLRQYPVLRSNEGPTTRNMANGQFMMFTRETYFHAGTHLAVKDEVLEDIAFAQIVKRLGHKCEVLFAAGTLVCRMYDTWDAFVRGWRRIFIELANRRPNRMRKHVATILTTSTAMPLCALLALAWGAGLLVLGCGPDIEWYALAAAVCGGAGTLAFYACMTLGVAVGGASRAGGLLYPLGSVLVAWIMYTAQRELVAGVPVKWAGKEYLRAARVGAEAGPIRKQPIGYEVPPKGALAGGVQVVVRPLRPDEAGWVRSG